MTTAYTATKPLAAAPLLFGQRLPPAPRGVPRPVPRPREDDDVCDERYFAARWWRAPRDG